MVRGLTHQHADYARFGVISAFDTALWDIVGKHHGVPVYSLLGGAYRDRIRTYTYIYDTVNMAAGAETIRNWTQRPEALAEQSARLVDEGFTGLKFDPIPQSRDGGATGAPWERLRPNMTTQNAPVKRSETQSERGQTFSLGHMDRSRPPLP